MAQPDTTTGVATSAAAPVASESAGVSQLQGLPLQSDRSRQAGNWRSPVPRSFPADFSPGSGVGLTTGPRSGSGAEGCHGVVLGRYLSTNQTGESEQPKTKEQEQREQEGDNYEMTGTEQADG
ncbi:hypothetical protein [Erwinia billingiae]|uniref:hypothetical protein n=1 Tax=Erwinia billingiae TaxID=182337 RepID=UPI003208D0D4